MAISKLPDLSPPTTRQALLDRIGALLPAPPADLDRSVRLVLATLGARIPQADARAVAHRLPPSLGQAILGRRDELLAPSCVAFEDRLQRLEIAPPIARAAIVEIAHTLGEQGRAHLRLQPLRPFLDR